MTLDGLSSHRDFKELVASQLEEELKQLDDNDEDMKSMINESIQGYMKQSTSKLSSPCIRRGNSPCNFDFSQIIEK